MKKVLLGLLALIGLVLVGVLGAAATRPDQIHVERSLSMKAAPQDVYPHLVDLREYAKWNPWSGFDPNQKIEFSEPSAGVGASYKWSGNDQVGVGSLTITGVDENHEVKERLVFTSPWQSEADVVMAVVPEGEGSKVTWAYDQKATFSSKLMMLVMDMDQMMGPIFLQGLTTLQGTAEAAAAARLAQEADAAAKAAEAAAAAAAPPTP